MLMYKPKYIPHSNCPISNFAEYPQIRMFISRNNDMELRIDILDDVIRKGAYTRLIIIPEYRLSQNDEKYFFECCHSKDLCVMFDEIQDFYKGFFEGFGIKYTSLSQAGQALEHFYIISHPCSGPKVVLYEDGYSYLAYNLDYMDFIEENENTSEEIMGLSEDILDIFNTQDNQIFLRSKEDCELIKKIYEEYFDIIKYHSPSNSQWLYLTWLYFSEGGYEFSNEIYTSLESSNSTFNIKKYNEFYIYRELLDGFFVFPGLPKGDLLEDYIHIQKDMIKEISMESSYDKLFQSRAEKSILAYKNETYFIREITSFREFCNETSLYESGIFGCLRDLMKNENSKFLIMRKHQEPDKSLAYIYLVDGKIKDIEKFNKVPWTYEEVLFLEKFFIKKRLGTKTLLSYFDECIGRYISHRQKISPEAIHYLEQFKKNKLIFTCHGVTNPIGRRLIKNALLETEKDLTDKRIFVFHEPHYFLHDYHIEALLDIGFKRENIIMSGPDLNINEVLEADIIYVTEGNTFEVLDLMRKRNIDELIKEAFKRGGKTYICCSAGAAIAGVSIEEIQDFDRNFVKMTDFRGLGLFDGIVIPHYTKEELARYIKNSPGIKGKYKQIISVANTRRLIIYV